MKANAPEKIYCGNNGHGNLSYSNLPFPNAVEYISTDAFVEKACEWLRKELCDYFDAPRGDYDMFVEDFRKYMKGEEV